MSSDAGWTGPCRSSGWIRIGAVVVLACLAVLAGCSLPAVSGDDGDQRTTAEPMTVRITAVEDGDTFWFRNDTGARVGIRLIGVDTPEVRGQNYPEEYEGIPDSDAGRQWLYRWGRNASNVTRERLHNETVRLEFDPALPRRDYYGRLVAYVYHDGQLVNRQLLQDGHARVYPVGFGKRASFREAEQAAREARRGVWNYTNGSAP